MRAGRRRTRESRGRRVRRTPLWIRWSAALLSPLLFLMALELLLAVIGYGRHQSFFFPWRHAGQTIHLTNHRYCEHFVPKHLARTPVYSVLSPKAAGTRRIFVFGGSAAYGDPEPAFGFCRQLEVLLNAVAKDRTYEVVNAAVTSMNSHVARRIARDCAGLDPDLFIVYMGNNEVVGPYGPPTLPNWLYARRGLINACMTAKQRFRLGQWLRDMSDSMSISASGVQSRAWPGMEAFLDTQLRFDDPKLVHCYRHFEANLRDIVTTAHAQGIKTLLCTVPTNLQACPPFGSLHDPRLSVDQLAEWQRRYEAGRGHQQNDAWLEALSAYDRAAALDDTFAELSYCRAQCLEALGRVDEAREVYSRAVDLDTLRFRAPSDINVVLRRQASALAGKGALLFDLERALQEAFNTEVLGDRALVDHVHLSVQGNFLAAHAALRLVRGCFPEDDWEEIGPPERLFQAFASGLLYDHAQQSRLALLMYRRKTLPPFVQQLDHDAEMARHREALFRARRAARDKSLTETEIRSAIQRRPNDPTLQRRYGDFLLNEGRPQEAARLYEAFVKDHSFNITLRLEWAFLYALQGETDRALMLLGSSQTPYRYDRRDGLLALAIRLVQGGAAPRAEALYHECLALDPDNLDALVNLAVIAGRKGSVNVEKQLLERALEIDARSPLALINLGNHHARAGQPDEARAWFVRALEADPYNHLAHIGMGIQTVAMGKIDEGVPHIIEAVKLKPDFADGYATLESIYRQIGLQDKAAGSAALKELFSEQADLPSR